MVQIIFCCVVDFIVRSYYAYISHIAILDRSLISALNRQFDWNASVWFKCRSTKRARRPINTRRDRGMLHKQKTTWWTRIVPLRLSLRVVARRTRRHVMFSERTHSKMAANAAIRFPTSRTTILHASFSFLFYCASQFAIAFLHWNSLEDFIFDWIAIFTVNSFCMFWNLPTMCLQNHSIQN